MPAEYTGDPLRGPHEEVSFTSAACPRSTTAGWPSTSSWTNPETDWDVFVYDEAGNVVAQSAAFGDTTEDAG